MAPALPAQSARPLGQGVLDLCLHTPAMPQGRAKRPFRPQTGNSRSHRPPLGVRKNRLKNPLKFCSPKKREKCCHGPPQGPPKSSKNYKKKQKVGQNIRKLASKCEFGFRTHFFIIFQQNASKCFHKIRIFVVFRHFSADFVRQNDARPFGSRFFENVCFT